MKNVNNSEAAVLWTAIAGLVIAALVEFQPGLSEGFNEALYNFIIVAGPMIGAAIMIRKNVYSKNTVKKIMEEK